MFDIFIITNIIDNNLIKRVWGCGVSMSVVQSLECPFLVSLHSY